MNQFLPFIDWIKNYQKSNFGGDLSAGLTVGVMLIPQGMAYAMLAGLPPIYGLYASTIPLIVYALLGTSRQLAVGPVAMVSLLIANGVGAMAEIASPEFVALAILLALMVGVIQLAMGIFRLGFLVNFLSHPVIAGFTSAAAIIIAFSQLKHLFGLNIPRGKVHETFLNIVQNFQQINLPTLALGLSSIALLWTIKKSKKRIPGPIVIVLLGIGLVYFLGLHEYGVSIIKDVPSGLPSVGLVAISWESVQKLLPIALTIAFVSFMESIAVAKAIQSKHKDYEIVPNQELIALGLSNVFGSFFQAFPTTGGFSRTAVNDQAGAKTGLASIISALLIVVTLLFFTPYFYYLPKAILAAIIMVAVVGLVDVAEAKHLWKTDRVDFGLFMITALGTLIFGIEEGIVIGVILSLAMMIYKVSYPHIAPLGRIPNSRHFRNLNRFDGLLENEQYIILRIDAPLFFANINYVRDKIDKMVFNNPNVEAIIISGQTINSVDSSAIHMLQDLVEKYKKDNIQLYFTGLIGPVRDVLKKAHLFEEFGEEHFFLHVNEAVDYIEHKQMKAENTPYVFQTN